MILKRSGDVQLSQQNPKACYSQVLGRQRYKKMLFLQAWQVGFHLYLKVQFHQVCRLETPELLRAFHLLSDSENKPRHPLGKVIFSAASAQRKYTNTAHQLSKYSLIIFSI